MLLKNVCFCFKDRTSSLVFSVSFCAQGYMPDFFFFFLLVFCSSTKSWISNVWSAKIIGFVSNYHCPTIYVFIISNPVHSLINPQSVVQFFHVSRELCKWNFRLVYLSSSTWKSGNEGNFPLRIWKADFCSLNTESEHIASQTEAKNFC